MHILKETLESLEKQGITVNTYACSDDDYRSAMYDYYHKQLSFYYQESEYVTDEEKAYRKTQECKDKWESETLRYVDKDINSSTTGWTGRWYEADNIYIRKGDMLIKRKSPGKSKMITEDWVLKAIEKEQKAYTGIYGQFAKDIQQMFTEKFGTNLGWIYPTTYGIGVWIFYNWKSQECIDKVTSVLSAAGIEYTNEFSDAHWVYRFKISKKEVNRKKIAA